MFHSMNLYRTATNTRGGWRTTSIYIHCAVPCCNSNTLNSTKFFVKVPNTPVLRRRWFKLAKIPLYLNHLDAEIHFCQDHFDVGSKENPQKLMSEPTKFECQYFKEELDPADVPIIIEDGIYTEPLCFEDYTEAISPILASCSEYQTPNSDSVQQFSYRLDDKRRTFSSSSEERNNLSSDIFRKISTIPVIMETADCEPLKSLVSPPGTPKVPLVMKKRVFHNVLKKRIDEHEHAVMDTVKITDDEIDNAIKNVNHDHYYYISKQSENSEVSSVIHSENALIDHAYAKESNLITITCFCCQEKLHGEVAFSKHFQEQHMADDGNGRAWFKCNHCEIKFYRKKDLVNHLSILRKSQPDDESTDSADSIPTFLCNYCNVEYIHKTSLLQHIKRKHTMKTDDIEIWKCEYCQRQFKFKENWWNHVQIEHAVRKKTEGAESEASLKCCDKDFDLNADLLIHIHEKHLDTLKETQAKEEKAIVMLDRYQFQYESFIASLCTEGQQDTIKTKEKVKKLDIMKTKENSDSVENIPLKCCCKKIFHHKNEWISHFQEQRVLDNVNRNRRNPYRNCRKPFKCHHCCTVFKHKRRLFKHVRRLQSDNESTDSADSIPIYTCNYCSLDFYHKTNLLAHIKNKHTAGNENELDPIMNILKCKYCPKEYKRKLYLLKHEQKEHVFHENTESPENKLTLKCDKELSSQRYMPSQFDDRHLDIQEQPQILQDDLTRPSTQDSYSDIQFDDRRLNIQEKPQIVQDDLTRPSTQDSYSDIQFDDRHLNIQEKPRIVQDDLTRPSTQDSYSDIQQESFDIQENHQDKQDVPLYLQQDSQDIREEQLDIKPEIFQCSKCPSSFLNEEEMSEHLQIMHGNLIDLFIDKLNCNKIDASINKDSSKLLVAKQCQNVDKRQTPLQEISSSYNFADLKTDIKKEISDPLEDIQLPYEQELGSNFILEQDFSENEYNIDTNVKEAYDEELAKDPPDTSDKETNLNPETVTIKMERFESESDLSNKFDIISGPNDTCVIPELVKCKSCQMTFPNQEELLDHMHDLINTKAKLYADAKQVLKTNCVQFKDPNTGYDKPFLNETELLDNIHRVYDKTEMKKFNLEIVGKNRIEIEENDCVNTVDPNVCKCCSQRLPIKIRIGKYDKICIKCKRIEKRIKNRRKSVKSQLYASTKTKQFKQPTEAKSGTVGQTVKPKTLADAEILKNMNKFFYKRLKELNHSSNKSKIDGIDVEKETLDPFMFGDNNNDLLKPLREEEEIIIVQPHDPKLCRSCLVPLEVTETSVQNKTVNILCDKCKVSETLNEKRKKSNGEMRKSNANKIDKTSKRYSELICPICRCKFRHKLALRKHVARSHL